ncbi:hypothetical protein Nstercoris_00458 [Nitrosomonas stercoris]|uniref:Uncharacterized protein n=1 Tax=Nitrosomonas stercoris TaxID=1444684 RepID=A0A4Y1YN31_9PROT|nr:hypothetical protein Nstercoris_00458 [Nitrosomonas stercoris]
MAAQLLGGDPVIWLRDAKSGCFSSLGRWDWIASRLQRSQGRHNGKSGMLHRLRRFATTLSLLLILPGAVRRGNPEVLTKYHRHREGRHCEEQRDVAAQLLGGDLEIRMQTNQ